MKKILLVDDHTMFREGLANILKSQPDYQVVGEAGTAHDAIELARHLKPDLVLMDFHLPDGTGVDATQTILVENPQTIVIFLTVEDSDEFLFPAIRSGAKGFLLKSQSSAELIASLRKIEENEAAITGTMMKRIVDEFSRVESVRETDQSIFKGLTIREFEVFKEISTGKTNRQIAEKLDCSEATIKNHVHRILSKLGLKNRSEAAWFARRYKI
jgi:DNA-binding NarL/FixJ family response regulator